MKKQLLTLIVLLTFTQLVSQSAYWVGGSGSYTDPSKWANASNGAPGSFAGGIFPNSPSHDIVFDDASDGNTLTAVPMTVTITPTNLNIGNITFTCVNTGTSTITWINSNAASQMVVAKNMLFANSTCPKLSGYKTNLSFRPTSAGSYTVDTKGVFLYGEAIFRSVVGAIYNVVSPLAISEQILVGDNPTLPWPVVTFQQDIYSITNNGSIQTLRIQQGLVNVNGNIYGSVAGTNNQSTLFVSDPVGSYTVGAGRVNCIPMGGATSQPSLNIAPGVKINAYSFVAQAPCFVNATGVIFNTPYFSVVGSTTVGAVTFSNCVINYSREFVNNFESVFNSTLQASYSGSTLTAAGDDLSIPSVMFKGGGVVFTEVNFNKFCNFYYDAKPTAMPTTSFKTLRFYNGASFSGGGTTLYTSTYGGSWTGLSGARLVSITPNGLLEFNGGRYISGSGTYSISVPATSTLALNGSCSSINQFAAGTLTLSPSTTVIGDYNKMEAFIIQGGVQKNCGANSYKVPGSTTTGWYTNPALTATLSTPAPRALYWAGPLPLSVGTNTTVYVTSNLAALTATNSYDYYGRWDYPENWSTNPLSTPGNNLTVGGTCPPTLSDSIVFPDHSYVRIVTASSECGDMRWNGRGVLADTNFASTSSRSLDIYGSCRFFNTLGIYGYQQNRYRGVTEFKSYKTYPEIQSNNNVFNYRVNFKSSGTTAASKWTLLDSLSVLPEVNFLGGAVPNQRATVTEGLINLFTGELITNNNNISCEAIYMTGAILTLGSNRIHIRYYTASSALDFVSPFTQNSAIPLSAINGPWINSGTSTIILHNLLKPGYSTLNTSSLLQGIYYRTGLSTNGGFNFYNVIFEGPNPVLFMPRTPGRIDTYNSIIFRQSGSIQQYTTSTAISTNTLITNSDNISVPYTMTIDTLQTGGTITVGYAHFKKNTDFNAPITYTNTLRLEPGYNYGLYSVPAATACVQTLASTATMVAVGTCSNMITIDGGKFVNQNAATQNCDNLVLSNNDATGGGGFNYGSGTSAAIGTVTGWTGTPRPVRTYYWVDNSVGITKFKWNDCSHWANTSGGTVGTIGIPSSQDDVVFDNNSFSTNNDTIEVDKNQAVNCNSMTWNNTNFSGVLKGIDSTCVLNIFGSLTFNANTINKFYGAVNFMCSTPTTNSITSAGKTFNWVVNFTGNSSAEWKLQDAFKTYMTQWNSPNNRYYLYSLNLASGKLTTNNNPITTEIFKSNGTSGRELALGTSSVTIFGSNKSILNISAYPVPVGVDIPVWEVTGSNYKIAAKSSVITFSAPITGTSYATALYTDRILLGKGQHYGTLNTRNSVGGHGIDGYMDTINTIHVLGRGFFIGTQVAGAPTPGSEGVETPATTVPYAGIANYAGYTSKSRITRFKIGNLTIANTATTNIGYYIVGYYNEIDTAIFNNSVSILSDNKYFKLLRFTAGATQIFLSGTVQWLQNRCEFKPIGIPGTGGSINMNSTVTNAQAYFRKDSGIVCSNYINIKDIHMIGNGGVYANTYGIGGSLNAGQSYSTNPSATAAGADCFGNFGNPLVDTTYTCGTPSYSTGLGNASTYFPLYTTTSGRADFQADFQANPSTYTAQPGVNVAGWSFRATSPFPTSTITPVPLTMCAGDSVMISFKIVGFPIEKVSYSYNSGSGATVVDSIAGSGQFHPSSGNGTAGSPYVWSMWLKPTATTTYVAGNVKLNRCFDDLGAGTGSVAITVSPAPSAPSYTVFPVSKQVCLNNTFTITSTPPAGVNVTWQSTPTNTTSINTSANSYTNNINAVGNYSYYAVSTVTATGCMSLTKPLATVTVNPLPTVTAATQTNVSCFGGSNAIATVSIGNGTPNYTYSWSPSVSSTTNTVSNLSQGTYSVFASDSKGCVVSQTFAITQPTSAISVLSSNTYSVLCFGASTGSASILATGGTPGYTYSWSPSISSVTTTATGLAAGNYMATIKDANNCVVTQSFVISQAPVAIISSTVSNVACFGTSTGSVTISVTGGTPIYSYSWTPGVSSLTNTATGLGVGNYSIIVKDANQCVITKTLSIAQPTSALSVVSLPTSSTTCYGALTGSASISATGGTAGYTYSWSPGLSSTTATVTGLAAGNYTSTIKDVNNCVMTQSFVIIEPTAIIATISNTIQAGCGLSNGSASVTATGGNGSYTYSWTTSSSSYTTAIATTNSLSAGLNNVTVIDNKGCTTTTVVAITNPNSPIITTSVSDVSCYGNATGVVTSTVSSGTPSYSYTWSNGSITSGLTNVAAGIYTLTVIDISNCLAVETVTVSQPTNSLSVLSISTTSIGCFGESTGSSSVIVTGGTAVSGNYIYNWGSAITSTTNSASGLSFGNYTVTITDDNSCSIIQPFAIDQPTLAISIAANTQTNVLCSGASNAVASVSITGGTSGYTYSWLPIAVTSTTSIANGLTSGSYTVNAADINGCAITQTFVITEPSLLSVSISNTTQASCGLSNGSASVIATGGTGVYTYSWTTPLTTYTLTTALTNSLSAGINNVTVVDANNCFAQANITITNPNAPVVTTTFTNINCYGSPTGVISTSVSGGSSYSYNWSNGAQTAALVNIPAGIYTVTVMDVNNCIAVETTTITQPASAISVLISNIATVNCFGFSTGSVDAVAIGGTPSYTYIWQPGAISNANLTNAAAGNYTLTVTDNNGCATNSVVSISTVSTAVQAVISESVQATCDEKNGSLTVKVTGGTPAYHYVWNTGTSNSTVLSNISAGNYTVIVSDAYGCTDTLPIVLDCKIDLLIPQLFSPNGDGKNDKFEIAVISNYPNNTISIFNRWGSLVYTKHKYNNEWDGKANVGDAMGKELLPGGTYFVVLDFGDEKMEPYHGFVQMEY